MCELHNKVFGKNAIIALAEIHQGKTVACEARIRYLYKQVKSLMGYFMDQGKSKQEAQDIVKGIYDRTVKLLVEPMDAEFIWSRQNDEAEDGLIEMVKPLDNHRHRAKEEYILARAYDKAMHDIAYRGYIKGLKAQEEERNALEDKWVVYLEKIQNAEKPSTELLRRCKRELVKQRFSSKLEQNRKLSYAQWAMLTNWVNRLLGDAKRYDIPEDNDNNSEDAMDFAEFVTVE